MGKGTGGRKLRIAYVCDGGKRLGLGHISRGRALLAKCTGHLVVGTGIDEVSSLFPHLPLVRWSTPDEPFAPEDITADVVVVDDYDLPEEWVAAISDRAPVAVVDDWKRPDSAAHVVINPNVGAVPQFYASSAADVRLCGARFSLIRPEVTAAGIGRQTRPGSVLVTLGGGNSTADLAALVSGLEAHGGSLVRSMDVVLGPASTLDGRLVRHTVGEIAVTVHRGPEDFATLCAESEVVVCSASTTSHEMAYLGVAFAPVVTADNQERIARGWEEAGVAPYLSVQDPDFPENIGREVHSLLRDVTSRTTRAARGRRAVDGRGPDRVMRALTAQAERFGRRPA